MFWALFGLLLTLAVTLLAAKNISLGSPIMAGDEYAYFALSREFPALDAIAAYDPTIQRTNNVFYFWIGHALWTQFPDPALAMRLLQSGLYCLMAVVAFRICRCFIGRWGSLALAAISCITAMSSYSAYFMPETLFQLLFFLLAATLVLVLPFRPMAGAALAGILAALLLLTKPHGVALVVAVLATMLACLLFPGPFAMSRRRAGAMLLTFAGVTYAAMVAANAGMTHTLPLSPMLFVGSFYQTTVAPPTTLPPWGVLRTVLLGNGVALAMLAGYPLAYMACGAWVACVRSRPREGRMEDASATARIRRARLALLTVFAAAALCCAAAMTIKYTADIGGAEMLRIHGRYYSFAIALCVLAMGCTWAMLPVGVALPVGTAWLLRIAGVLGIAVLLVVQFWWRHRFTLAPWDFPEIWSFGLDDFSASGARAGTILVTIGGLCLLAGILKPTYGALLFLVFVGALDASNLERVTRWQFAHGQAFGPYSRPALAMSTLLAGPALDHGIVIGPDRGMLTYTLFNMRSRSRVMLLAQDSTITPSMLDDNADWVLLQGHYDIQIPGRVYLQTDKLTLIGLKPLAPELR
jgi:phosphoglycerol transferase